MAEIYTTAAGADQGYLSPDTSDHINSVLSDLGLGGTSGDSSGAMRTASEPVETTTATSAPGTGVYDTAPTADLSQGTTADHASAILVGSGSDAAPGAFQAPAAETPAISAPLVADTHAFAPQASVAGADSLSASHGATYIDAFGGLGTDTLWGSDAGSYQSLSSATADPAGGDTIRSSGGGMDTIYGGNATIYASGHSITSSTDTVHASGDGTSMDGSASPEAPHTDGASSFDHFPGGSGSDTIILHDATGTYPAAMPDDTHAAYGYGSQDDPAGSIHDATYLGYGSPDSVVGGDGSDHFALLGYDSYGGTGAGDDGSTAHDPYLAGGQVTHSDAGTFVSYHDGYGTGYADPDQLRFEDTVMAG